MKRGTRLAATALASVLAVGLAAGGTSGALAGHDAVRGSATPSGPSSLDAVPWSSIGQGWILAQWIPHPRARHPYVFLEVVSPSGARYVLYRTPFGDLLEGWSGDGQRVLLTSENSDGSTTVTTLELRTGAVLGSFTVPGSASASFSRPAGLAVFASFNASDHQQQLTRYSFTGALQRAFPEAIGGMGRWNGWWAMSPDGVQLAVGYNRGIAVLRNDGSLVATLHAPGLRDCAPTRWWTATAVLARCQSGAPYGKLHLFLFSASWTGPRALTRYPQGYDFGDFDAWRVDSSVFVQALSGCGPGWVGELHGVVPVMVKIPPFGSQPSEGDNVVGATGSALAVESTSCIGQASIGWYTPSTSSVQQVLGPPLSGGNLGEVLTFPSPTS